MREIGIGLGMNLGGGGRFSPTQLSGLVLWLRADLGITLNGGNVSAWADQSGTGDANKNTSQGTAGLQPVYSASDAAYNGKPTVTFDGSDDVLVSGAWALAQPLSLIVVGHNTNASATDRLAVDFNGAGAEAGAIANTNVPNLYFGAYLASTGSWAAKSAFLGVANGGSSSVYFNSLTATAGPGNAGAVGIDSAHVGQYASTGANFSWTGPIAEIIVYSKALSATERAQILTYLGSRYGITIAP